MDYREEMKALRDALNENGYRYTFWTRLPSAIMNMT